LASFLETATDIAREAAALVREFAGQNIGFELKGDYDLVTAADRASENRIVERLRAEFPSHSIVGEEGGERAGSSTEYRWYVDPLDGTTNFAHGFPVYNVTLGLERNGELIAGVIADPTRDEIFTAERGAGAFLNGKPIHVSKVNRIEDALAATGFPSRRRHQNVNIHFFYQMAMLSHGVRRPGAAALDLAYVACGRLDLFWEFHLHPWDMAAGILLVQEAGGVCSDMRGAAPDLHGPHILADNGLVHQETLALFTDIFAGRYRQSLPELPERADS
jgi:myo-inositol-1(or 4)-monophosphatase